MEPHQRVKLQKTFSCYRKQVRTNAFGNTLSNSELPVDIRNVAMHTSCRGPHEAGWVQAVPKSEELTMTATLFRRAARTRMLVPDPNHLYNQKCRCKLSKTSPTIIDPMGDHYQKCNLNNALTVNMHSNVQRTIKEQLCLLTLSAVKWEPSRSFAATEPANQKRLDLSFQHPNGGNTIGYDISITHPVPRNLTMKQAMISGRAAAKMEKMKITKYAAICEANRTTFVPMVLKAGGAPGQRIIKKQNRVLNTHPDGGHQAFRQYWNMRISVALQKGIANALLIRENSQNDIYRKRESGGIIHDDIDIILDSTYLNTGGNGPIFKT